MLLHENMLPTYCIYQRNRTLFMSSLTPLWIIVHSTGALGALHQAPGPAAPGTLPMHSIVSSLPCKMYRTLQELLPTDTLTHPHPRHNSVFSQAKKMSLSLSTQDKTCMRNLLLPWLQLLELILLMPNLCLSEIDGKTPTDFSKRRIWLLVHL